MLASISENPYRAARMTDWGLPPTPTQTGKRPDSVCGTTALKHADGIVRAQYGDCRPDADASRACGDRGEHHVGGGQREVIGVVFTDPEEVDADLVGEDTLFHDVPDCLRM